MISPLDLRQLTTIPGDWHKTPVRANRALENGGGTRFDSARHPLASAGDEIRPKVTVFVPFFNRELYLGATIESVLGQSFGDFELLLLDDGSTDGSRDVVASYNDPRIRLEFNERNLGIPRTRNRGLELARGEYLALLDSDDLAHPQRLERQVRFLDQHSKYAEIGTWCGFIDEYGKRLSRVKRHTIDPDDVRAEMLFRCPISNRSVMGRLAILRNYPYRPDLPACEDVEVHYRIARDHPVGNLPEVLVYGREHPGRTSRILGAQRLELHGRIKRDQLEALGVMPTTADLARHVAIGRRGVAMEIDADYLDWAHEWLSTLHEANRRIGLYDRDAFVRALGLMWVATCWHGRSGLGARLPISIMRAPWVGGALAYGARRNIRFFRRPDPA